MSRRRNGRQRVKAQGAGGGEGQDQQPEASNANGIEIRQSRVKASGQGLRGLTWVCAAVARELGHEATGVLKVNASDGELGRHEGRRETHMGTVYATLQLGEACLNLTLEGRRALSAALTLHPSARREPPEAARLAAAAVRALQVPVWCQSPGAIRAGVLASQASGLQFRSEEGGAQLEPLNPQPAGHLVRQGWQALGEGESA